jgi:hypothetical protein
MTFAAGRWTEHCGRLSMTLIGLLASDHATPDDPIRTS